jgi:hypothetical protein
VSLLSLASLRGFASLREMAAAVVCFEQRRKVPQNTPIAPAEFSDRLYLIAAITHLSPAHLSQFRRGLRISK